MVRDALRRAALLTMRPEEFHASDTVALAGKVTRICNLGVPGVAGCRYWQWSAHHIAGIHIRLFDPFDDFKPAVEMLDDRGTTFDPVAAIHVNEAALASNCRVMNMTANHAVNITTPGFGSQGTFVLANEIDG